MDDQVLNDSHSESDIVVHEAVDTTKIISTNTNEVQQEVLTNLKALDNLKVRDKVINVIKQEINEEVLIYDKDLEIEDSETVIQSNEVIQVCDVNSLDDINETQSKLDDNINVVDNEINVHEKNDLEIGLRREKFLGKNSETESGQSKNYKSVILEDWEVDVSQGTHSVAGEQPQIVERIKNIETIKEAIVNQPLVGETTVENSKNPIQPLNMVQGNQEENLSLERKIETLKIPKSISKNEIVKILDESSERVVKPIVTAKGLFFSIELTKKLNEKLSQSKSSKMTSEEKSSLNVSCNNNNTIDDRQKIVDILEAEEIKDWQSVPNKSNQGLKENGSDMEISQAIKIMERGDICTHSPLKNAPVKTPKKNQQKKIKILDKELEKSLALQQLREEFPITRKRLRTTKKVKHIPFLASTVLEKAMTSPEVSTALKPGPPKRRPCYLPDNLGSTKHNADTIVSRTLKPRVMKVEESIENVSKPEFEPNAVVKTYSVKRKSTDTESEIKSTIAAVTKALSESAVDDSESKPKKQKTVKKSDNKPIRKIIVNRKKKKINVASGNDKKRSSELEKLLGDEGAVRMLYDTQHGSTGVYPAKKLKHRTSTGLKKDLVLKTKLVKNAVMRLSGVGVEGVALRGKRRSLAKEKINSIKREEPLFTSTPNIVLYKPKKKQRAEASRILYRHSSSESFDSSEECRRKSIEADCLIAPANAVNGDESEDFTLKQSGAELTKPKKSEIIIRRKVKKIERPQNILKTKERHSFNSPTTSKLILSNVPVRKSSRPRIVSRKYSIWSSTSMDCLSVESLGFKKLKKASSELGKKLNLRELNVLQYEHLVQVVLAPSSTFLKNSFDTQVLQELVRVFSYLSEYDHCKAVLLSSQGNTFCQGVDINKIITFSETEKKKGISDLIRGIREFVKCLSEFKKPTIAGVDGAAIGLGTTILPYFDLVLSTDKAFFYAPYVKLGQTPEGAPTHTFPRISRLLVSELLFKSHKMTASDALKYGLITQIIPEDRFEEELILTARNMAVQPTQGINSIKFLTRSIDQDEIDEILRAEGELLEEQWNSKECINNMIKLLNSGDFQMKTVESKL